MYSMIALNQIKPGKVEAVKKALERDFVPILKKTNGFRAAYSRCQHNRLGCHSETWKTSGRNSNLTGNLVCSCSMTWVHSRRSNPSCR